MPESVNFKHKISRQRPYGKAEPSLRASEGNLGAVIDQLESDRGRIINSAAVRRSAWMGWRRHWRVWWR
jgi:dGTPase